MARRPTSSTISTSAELYAICDEVEAELTVQPLPGPPIPAERAAAPGCRAARLGARRDPAMDGLCRRRCRHGPRRRSMTETYLPRATAAGARPRRRATRRSPRRRSSRRGAVATAADRHRPRRNDQRGALRRRDRVRRGDPDAGAAAAVWARPASGTPCSPPIPQSSWRRASTTRSTSPTTCPSIRSASSPPTCRSAARRRARGSSPSPSATTGRGSARPSSPGSRSPSTTRRSRARAAGASSPCPAGAIPIVTYHLTRRDRALLGRGLARLALVLLEAGATAVYPSYRGAPIVRARRDLAVAAGDVHGQPGQPDDRPPVLDGADGWRPATLGNRQPRPRPRHDQRVRQRCLAAARCTRRQPAGVGDGRRHPQRPSIPRRAGRARCR